MNACLDVSDVFRGQFRFITDDPFFLENAGLVGDVTEGDLVVVNQDLVVTLCERVASKYNLACTPEAAKRIAEVADESPFKTHSFKPPFEFKKYQNRCWHALRNESRVLIQSSPGTGKGIPLYEKILYADGSWRPMGEVAIGDELVDQNGKVCHITAIFPLGQREIWEVEFADGTVIECCKDHLWKVSSYMRSSKDGSPAYRVWKVMNTKQIYEDGVKRPCDGKPKYKVPTMGAVEFSENDIELPIDPYVLGVALGDGCLTVSGFIISSDEQDIIDRVSTRIGMKASRNPHNYSWNFVDEGSTLVGGKNRIGKAIDELGLRVCSGEKFIPDVYFTASVKQRKELLSGLFDTDGCVRKNGSLSFSSTSSKLVSGIVRLCNELGYRTKVSKDNRSKYKSEDHSCYSVVIMTDDAIFTSKKHWGRYEKHVNGVSGRRRTYDALSITDIRPTGRFTEMACISVDSPTETYVTENYIVTHNTAMANSLFCDKYDRGLCGRIVVVCPAPLVTDWVNSVKNLTSLSVATTKPSWTAAKRKKFYEEDSSTVWVINYEKFRCDDYEHIEKALKKDKPLFVFDEVHKVAKRTSAIHRNIAKMTRRLKASGIIAMTATPIINGPEDFYNEFRIIDPELFGGVADFERRFTVNSGEKDYWNKYLGYVNVPYLHIMAGSQVFSCNKSRPEIACEFPAKDEQLVTYDLSPKMQKLYDEIFDYGHSMPMEERECALFFLEFVRLCNMPETLLRKHEYADTPYGFQLQHIDQICERYRQHILDRKNCAKLQLATEKMDELMRAGEKVIVFARHTHNCIIPLADEWKAWKPLLYTGEQSQGERDEIKRLFKQSCDRNLIIMSDAGQVGLNFQEARYLMHYDTPTSHAAYEQRSDRLHRIDSTFDSVTIIRFMGLDTVEEAIENTMWGRYELSQQAGFQGSEYQEVPALSEGDAGWLAFGARESQDS